MKPNKLGAPYFLIIKMIKPDDNIVQFMLAKGAQLDAGIISPKQLYQMYDGTYEEQTIEEKIQHQVLKSVMNECTEDIIGKCTLKQAVDLIRALNHKQEVKLVLYEQIK